MTLDWTKLYKDYRGKWVALQNDQRTVIASANTLRSALAQAKKLGHDDPYLTRVPLTLFSDLSYVFIR